MDAVADGISLLKHRIERAELDWRSETNESSKHLLLSRLTALEEQLALLLRKEQLSTLIVQNTRVCLALPMRILCLLCLLY